MGSDNLVQFSRWRRWQDIAAAIPIAVVRRPGSVLAPLSAALARRMGVARHSGSAPSLVVLDGRRNEQSSTCCGLLALIMGPLVPLPRPAKSDPLTQRILALKAVKKKAKAPAKKTTKAPIRQRRPR